MRSLLEVEAILDQLEDQTAEELEGQDLDFKDWDANSMDKALRTVIDWAVCMANGGGGTVVFGVADKVRGRASAVVGVPPEVDVNRLKLAVYDATDPKLTPVFEELRVPEGTGRLIVMQIYPGLPPYTDTKGRGTIRVGRDCKPLTGTLRRKLAVETGESDFSAVVVDAPPSRLLSAAAMETLREVASRERAPADLLGLGDVELLDAIGVVKQARLTRAGLLLGGSDAAIREHIPGYVWTHLRLASDTDYTDRADGHDTLTVAIGRLLDRIHADNPIQTVRQGLFHFEYRTYPEIALREALLNALCHADYRIASPILVKQFQDRIEITNPGGLMGGITPENILHHTPVTRNPCLVDALVRLRLINRSNLGIQRMYTALLIEGKEPPSIVDLGDAFRLTFRASKLSPAFRAFVAEEGNRGVDLSVDQLLILQHLLRHPEIDSPSAARLCQRSQEEIREILPRMERDLGYLDRGGSGRGTYWTLRADTHARLAAPGDLDRDRRTDWEAAKTRVLSILRQRSERGEPGMSNKEIRAITRLDRNQVVRLLGELRREDSHVKTSGYGAGARYFWGDA
ncbi:MAG: putative DNA binding domain-containing protein [Bradymonadales bacterium]|nr:putative DNA binding domain-containing protein [Bradymonadales bacterium]